MFTIIVIKLQYEEAFYNILDTIHILGRILLRTIAPLRAHIDNYLPRAGNMTIYKIKGHKVDDMPIFVSQNATDEFTVYLTHDYWFKEEDEEIFIQVVVSVIFICY